MGRGLFACLSPKPLRIERRTEKKRSLGYDSHDSVTTQYLMKGNTVLDSEIVPEDVLITLACLGDTGEWRSKWHKSHPELYNVRKSYA